jgi:hypothetical protein
MRQDVNNASVVTVSTEELRDRMTTMHGNIVELPNLVKESQRSARHNSTGEKIVVGYACSATH